jgi:hypothetical protein
LVFGLALVIWFGLAFWPYHDTFIMDRFDSLGICYNSYGVIMTKETFTRSQAIAIMLDMDDPDMDPEDKQDYETMTNEELGSELCSSGYIHDEDFGGVFDD